jgi:hypothetical protein
VGGTVKGHATLTKQVVEGPDPEDPQNISVVENGRLNVVHRTSIEDGIYEPEADYTTQPF